MGGWVWVGGWVDEREIAIGVERGKVWVGHSGQFFAKIRKNIKN